MGKKAGFHPVKPGSSPGIVTMPSTGCPPRLISVARAVQLRGWVPFCALALVSWRISYICAARIETGRAQAEGGNL